MDKEPKLKSTEKIPRKGLFGRLGLTATANQSTQPARVVSSEAISQRSVNTLVEALKNRKNTYQTLGKGKSAEFRDIVQRDPLIERSLPDGRRNALTHLIFVGESVLGVDSVFSSTGHIDEMAIRVLPIGRQMPTGRFNVTAASLFRFLPGDAFKPGQDGVRKEWETAKITRNEIGYAYNIHDPTVSNEQAEISFTSQGTVIVRDLNSTNGTEVMNIDTLMRSDAEGPLRDTGEDLRLLLEAHPHMWSSQYADQLYESGK